MLLQQGTAQLPEDDLRIETCWSDFKSFNLKIVYICALVGVLIKCLIAYVDYVPSVRLHCVIMYRNCVTLWKNVTSEYTFYTVTLFNFVVQTPSVWQVIHFREIGVVHRMTYSFGIFFLLVLFAHFILDIKSLAVSSQTTKSHFIKITQSFEFPHSHLSLTHNFRTRLSPLLERQRPLSPPNIFPFKSLPS